MIGDGFDHVPVVCDREHGGEACNDPRCHRYDDETSDGVPLAPEVCGRTFNRSSRHFGGDYTKCVKPRGHKSACAGAAPEPTPMPTAQAVTEWADEIERLKTQVATLTEQRRKALDNAADERRRNGPVIRGLIDLLVKARGYVDDFVQGQRGGDETLGEIDTAIEVQQAGGKPWTLIASRCATLEEELAEMRGSLLVEEGAHEATRQALRNAEQEIERRADERDAANESRDETEIENATLAIQRDEARRERDEARADIERALLPDVVDEAQGDADLPTVIAQRDRWKSRARHRGYRIQEVVRAGEDDRENTGMLAQAQQEIARLEDVLDAIETRLANVADGLGSADGYLGSALRCAREKRRD